MKPEPKSSSASTKPTVDYVGLTAKLAQPEDTDGRAGVDRQYLDVELVGGPDVGGFYVAIATERWAVDDAAEWNELWRSRVQPLLDLAEPTCKVSLPAAAPRPARALACGGELEAALQGLTQALVQARPDKAGAVLVSLSDLKLVLRAVDRFREGDGAIVS